MHRCALPFAMLMAAMLAACNGELEKARATNETPFVPAQRSAEDLMPPQRDVATLAIEALAEELDITKDAITVDTVRAIDWPDSSIGCPQPGRAYMQVITPGHKVTLRVNGRVYVVHEANARAFVCHQTKAYAGVDPQLELVFGPQMIAALKDLATRLRVPENDIKPVSAKEHTWNDASLGCPEPGRNYPVVQVTGWVMTLRHNSRDYTYHTDLQRTIPCPAITTE